MAITPDALHLLAQQVLDCVCDAVDDVADQEPDYPGCPCRACVVAGVPAHDNCCDTCPDDVIGGQMHVWVGPMRPYTQGDFPNQQSEVQGFKGCLPPGGIAVDLTVELVRCSPSQDELGNPPSCEDLERTARIVNIDLLTIYRAIRCCMPEIQLPGIARRGRKYLMGASAVVGPDGGCVASRQTVTVDLGSPCLCPSDGGSP